MNYETHGPDSSRLHDTIDIFVLGFMCGLIVGIIGTALLLP